MADFGSKITKWDHYNTTEDSLNLKTKENLKKFSMGSNYCAIEKYLFHVKNKQLTFLNNHYLD